MSFYTRLSILIRQNEQGLLSDQDFYHAVGHLYD